MYDRAMDALYTPGSTFKVVTLSAALETGTASLTSTYQAPGSMDIGNAPVTNDANESYGTISLQQAFAVSSNVVFGQVANEVGANSLVQFANAFGYGQKLGQDLTTAASIMADPSLMTEWETAWAGAGQPVGMDHAPTSTLCLLALRLTIHPRLPSRWPWRITTNTTSRRPRLPASS